MKIGQISKYVGLTMSAIVLTPQISFADKANDDIVWASSIEVENATPYYNNVREGLIIGRHVFDTMIYQDPDTGDLNPMLAESWNWVDATTLDFVIRDGVKFHNGDSFSADDVVFTINYVVSPESRIVTRSDVDWIKSAEKLDARTVRIHLKEPFPAALSYFAGPIVFFPAKYFQAVGLDEFSKMPIGTGPYKIVDIDNALNITMDRNEDYWSESPVEKPNIGKIVFRPIADPDTQIAELLSGGVDWIWKVSPDQAKELAKIPNLTVSSSENMRIASLNFDVLGRTDPNSPFKDVRVRQAISYAIDRNTIAKELVGKDSQPLNSFCYPEQYGCAQDVPLYEYNPELARDLLAQAGYPDGFDTVLWASGERDNVEAIMGYLRAVGIRTELNQTQYPVMQRAVWEGKAPMFYMTWSSGSILDVSAITSVFFGGGDDDMARDPQVIEWIRSGDTSVDAEQRKAFYKDALVRIAREAYALPLYNYTMNYAYTKDLDFKGRADGMPRFYESKWK